MEITNLNAHFSYKYSKGSTTATNTLYIMIVHMFENSSVQMKKKSRLTKTNSKFRISQRVLHAVLYLE